MAAINSKTSDPLNIYLIGNNPLELSHIYDNLKAVKNIRYKTQIDFNLSGIFRKIMRFKPSCILIDDNLEKFNLVKLIKKLNSHAKTKNIPITIIKNSNYHDSHLGDVQDYLLKQSLTPHTLQRSIFNSMRFKRMQVYLYKTYKRGKGELHELFKNQI
ncbi:hypothetical protein FNH22_01095 [Fulvivirga sp. M361]|uniref:hypothetical protein n=1 Tax=Fulvivirga sp. M361 TaxID=2594266 RepID=UPI00117A9E85|nr:hypothetical protein [Fulvivirga sp. M361]TRX62723.1 hypothetical protein FNH22_01095 [Fulvivirga sp. M361]